MHAVIHSQLQSYSWETPWDILILYLTSVLGKNGVVWVDLLACTQAACIAGDLAEVHAVPSVINFIGQTVVMPGTMSRLWCLFEMAYS